MLTMNTEKRIPRPPEKNGIETPNRLMSLEHDAVELGVVDMADHTEGCTHRERVERTGELGDLRFEGCHDRKHECDDEDKEPPSGDVDGTDLRLDLAPTPHARADDERQEERRLGNRSADRHGFCHTGREWNLVRLEDRVC
jgi:hypothetical protein